MKDNFDKELRKKYLQDFNIDIEEMAVLELLKKSKTKPIARKMKLVLQRAALEKKIYEKKVAGDPNYMRRGEMQKFLSYYKNDDKKGMHVVWRGYLLHIKEGVDLPPDFDKRIKSEMKMIAKEAVGEDHKSFDSFRKKEAAKFRETIERAETILKVLDTVMNDDCDLESAYRDHADKDIKPSQLKNIYNRFVECGDFRKPR